MGRGLVLVVALEMTWTYAELRRVRVASFSHSRSWQEHYYKCLGTPHIGRFVWLGPK